MWWPIFRVRTSRVAAKADKRQCAALLTKLTTAGLGILFLGTVIGTAIVLFNPARFFLDTLPDAWAALIGLAVAALFAVSMVAAVRGRALLVIGLAVIARIAAYLAFAVYPGTGDAPAYDNIARNIVAGHGIIWTNTFYMEPLTFSAYHPPLYSSLLAGAYALFGSGPLAAFLLNIAGDALVALSICQLARLLGHPRAGLPAVAIYLILPETIAYSVGIQKETWALFFLLQVVIGLWRRQALWIGVFTAAVALTQPAWLAVVAGMGLALLPRNGVRATTLLALRSLPLFLILLAPWWIRNYHVFGQFVPLNTAYGHNLLYIATNRFDTIKPFVPLGNELAVAHAAYSAAFDIIKADPLKYFLGRIIRVVESMCLDGFPMQLLQYGRGWTHSMMAGLDACQASYCVLMGAAFAAKKGRAAFAPLLLAVAISVIFGMWFEFSERHRYFLMPLLALLAATIGEGKAGVPRAGEASGESPDEANPDLLRGGGGACDHRHDRAELLHA